ncbi:hypothetical protein K4L44_05700 [Halosquirtibacter laminarini]|uniref:Uncharacterized protein n=1 Tax=Halosquirtibacter laminarini TaxID=3374600 RepID=A0AC61NQ76_9BACT|nr:hypothetical protein K4L44_05700 [Prolixibacteraceae bacterium]
MMMRNTTIFTVSMFLILSIVGCNKDESSVETNKGDLLFISSAPNPDGQTGANFMQLADGLKEKKYTNLSAFPISYGVAPIIIDKKIYITPGWSNESSMLKRYVINNGQLSEEASLQIPLASGASNIVKSQNKLYMSMSKRGKIMVIDPSTLKKIKEIDLSSYGVGDQNPDPSCMVVRDDLLYVGLNQMVGGYFPSIKRAASDVLILDTKTDKVVKMITTKLGSISQPTRPLDPNSIFMDENHDIYIVCLGGFGAVPGQNAGILRIKNGETEFDDSYSFVINQVDIADEPHRANVFWSVKYARNGKMYACVDIPDYHGTPANYIEDRSVLAVEVDIYAKTIRNIGLPRSNSFSGIASLYKDKALFGLATTKYDGYFSYDLNSKKVSDKPHFTTTGYASFIIPVE